MPSRPPTTAFARHVYAVQRYVSLTAPRYAPLFESGLLTHPICCFGTPLDARIITIGLNPSHGEFDGTRNWPKDSIEHTVLAERCCNYFAGLSNLPAPHPWFKPWSEGLKSLNASFDDGSAVHLDLSPRPTNFIRALKETWEQDLFLEMVERDLWVFFGTLELCSKARLLIMAGTVTGKYYINQFLQRYAPDYGFSLDGPFNRLEHPGRAKIAWHKLSGHGRELKVFFCSSSPSDKDKRLLPLRIRENAADLNL